MDQIDEAQVIYDRFLDLNLRKILNEVNDFKVGHAGECEHCNEMHIRIVNNHCPPCRDRLKLP